MSSAPKAGEILRRALRNGRLHHAILLYGNSAPALEAVARDVAGLLLGRPCVRHPDLFELRPEGKMRLIKIGSSADRAGGDWPPNTMRKLLRDIRQSSALGGRKVAIVHEADRMNAESANAFLKTLEEPPPDTTIFMLTTRPNDLLDTIRSRCIALRVESEPEPLGDGEWLEWLEDFKKWQKSLMGGIRRGGVSAAVMGCYALVARFGSILGRLADELSEMDEGAEDELDDEMLEAVRASERRALRKRLLADVEDACVGCALGGNGVPAVKIARAVGALEKAAAYMELNMPDAPAMEYFMLSSLRIWAR